MLGAAWWFHLISISSFWFTDNPFVFWLKTLKGPNCDFTKFITKSSCITAPPPVLLSLAVSVKFIFRDKRGTTSSSFWVEPASTVSKFGKYLSWLSVGNLETKAGPTKLVFIGGETVFSPSTWSQLNSIWLDSSSSVISKSSPKTRGVPVGTV